MRWFLAVAVWGVGATLVSPGLRAQDANALTLLEEAGSRYAETSGFCAAFEQTLVVPLLGETTYSKGSLCQERPNLFAMRFSDPEGDILVADGEFFWVYYPSTDPRQVLQFELEARPGGVDFQREFLEEPGEKYRMEYMGEESVAGRTTKVVDLTPLDPSGYQNARIWLDSQRSLILQARIEMENGSVRTVTLTDIQLNPAPDPGRFRFSPPEGAQVIRR
jgi:outer membrane lipoprotein carrier protein